MKSNFILILFLLSSTITTLSAHCHHGSFEAPNQPGRMGPAGQCRAPSTLEKDLIDEMEKNPVIQAEKRCQEGLQQISLAWTRKDFRWFWFSHRVTLTTECCDVVSSLMELYSQHASQMPLFNVAAKGLLVVKCTHPLVTTS